MADCLFCRMVRKELQPNIEFETPDVLAIHDIHPQAPHHVLVIPKKHIAQISAMTAADSALIGHLVFEARQIAERRGWKDYRLVFNNGAGAGQSVFHIHLHLLAGRPMTWPPG